MATARKDIRWKQRFAGYLKTLALQQRFVDKGVLSELEKLGLVKAFEYTYELAWNTLKGFSNTRAKPTSTAHATSSAMGLPPG
ncbi:MAG: nucleotidyltransferase substrate binding protein [Desulfobulbaceae bacterium]|nr:nucleotidyltransferase substrate binding protein [Desulfobulbaceae bacterium]